MERRHQRHALIFVPAPAQMRDRRSTTQQDLRRELPERHDDAWTDQRDLPVEKGLARDDLVGLRIAIVRRTALHDVRDVDVVAAKAHALRDDVGEEHAGAPDERDALAVLVLARSFTDEHQVGRCAADSEDDVRAPFAELAARTIADHGAQLVE
jgi:hypothetical protein